MSFFNVGWHFLYSFVCRILKALKPKCSLFTFCVSTKDGIPYELNNQRLLVIHRAAFFEKYELNPPLQIRG